MKNRDLIISVIKKYEKMQDISRDLPGPSRINLKRGTKHVISSYLEDITGAFIADLLPKTKYTVLVDQTFTFENSKKQFRPDITIIRNAAKGKYIVGFFEVKDSPNPFRWNERKNQNRGKEYVVSRIKRIDAFRNSYLKYKDLNQLQHQILVDKDVILDLVFFSDKLFSDDKMTSLKNYCDKNKGVKLHILLRGCHPNVKSSQITANQLIKKIKNGDSKIKYSVKTLKQGVSEIKRNYK